MKLMINHQTHYQYSDWAKNSIQYIKMTPQSNLHQQVTGWQISIPGEKQYKKDAFNNIWLTSSQTEPYQQMLIMAQGIVEINTDNQLGLQDALAPAVFLQPTTATLCNDEMIAFAEYYLPQKSWSNFQKLAEALLQYMPYITASTTVTHTAIASFSAQQGVCQDHSHVLIAMAKVMGIPARYVSGYLYVNNQSHLASHAWAEVYLEGRWHMIDVSNQLFSPQSHVYVAVGRDYWDVAPVRGIREKGGAETMYSIVQVLAC
jgi:transglutaminase-like putative cysteine protease